MATSSTPPLPLFSLFCQVTIFGQKIQISTSAETSDIQQLSMNINEAIDIIKELNTNLIKAKGEILGKISQLENSKGELTTEQANIVNSLRQKVQNIDDIIPDADIEPDPTPEPTEPKVEEPAK